MSLQFVNTDSNHRELTDKDRRLIGRNARRVGAATRRIRGDSRKINVLQIPDFLVSPDEQSDNGEQPQQPPHLTAPSAWSIMSASACSIIDWSVLLQPELSGKVLGHAAAAESNMDPRRWVKICRLTESPLLQVLPLLYGHSTCLDDATECMIARIRCCLRVSVALSETEGILARTYGRAIRSLSTAIARGSVDQDIWYATLLLALFELLDHSSSRAWIMHSQGAFKILEGLGPRNISTEIDKDIFIAQVELMITEATFANMELFIDRPVWQHAIQRAVSSSSRFGSRSEPAIAFWVLSARVPGVFKRVTDLIMNQDLGFRPKGTIIDELEQLLEDLTSWKMVWYTYLTSTDTLQDLQTMIQCHAILRKYFADLALVYRCLCALHLDVASAVSALAAADAAIEIARPRGSPEPVYNLCAKAVLQIAWSIQLTSDQWLAYMRRGSDAEDAVCMISAELFRAWCETMGRATMEISGYTSRAS